MIRVLVLILTVSRPPGWSWYNSEMVPDSDTTMVALSESVESHGADTGNSTKNYWEKLIAQNPGDTVKLGYLYAMSRMGLLPFDRPLVLQDPLPVEPDAPEPIKRLLLHPNRENARRFLAWMTAIFLRAHVISKLVSDVGREYGLEDFMGVSVRAANDSLGVLQLDRIKSLENRFVIMVFAGDDIFSRHTLENLKFALQGLNLPVVVVHREPLSEGIKTVFPSFWITKYDEGEFESLKITRVPTVVAIDMKNRRVHYVARVPVPSSEFRKRLENLLYEEGAPILLNQISTLSQEGVRP